MRLDILGAGLLTTLLLAVAPVASAGEADAVAAAEEEPVGEQLRVQEQEMTQLKTHLRKRLHLGDAEITGLEPECQRYFRLNGEQEPLRAMLRVGVEEGCQGECLREMVRSMNRAMVWGVQDHEAGEMVQAALRYQLKEQARLGETWTQQELGDGVRAQIREQLRLFERERERLIDQEMLREQEREQERERTREQIREMDRTGSGPKPDRPGTYR